MLICFYFQLKLYASWSDANPRIDNTYRGEAYNLDTLNRTLYTDMTFINANHPNLLYCFQFLFPFLTTILIVVYVICSHLSMDMKKVSKNLNSFATTTAHAFISFVFILYVLLLDFFALVVRNGTPEYYSDMYNKLLFDYPGVLLFWDIIALFIFAISAWIAARRRNENTFPLLVEVGIVPLLCFASHAHYIFIAWITDPHYATSIGIYYAVCYIIHLFLFKRTYKGVYCKCKAVCGNNKYRFLCAFGTAVGVFFIALSYQVLITVFVVFIPINNAIENTPSRLFIAIQSVGALLLGFLAYQIILGKESLSIITGAVRKVIKKQPTFYTGSKEWKDLNNEEKFAEFLHHHVFKTNSVHNNGSDTNDNTTSANSVHDDGSDTSDNTTSAHSTTQTTSF